MSELPSHPPGAPGADVGPPSPRVADHELIRCIGQGSYGRVWLARTFTGAWRAVKVIYRHTFFENEREYEREFQGIQRYEPISRSHPSLLQILHVGRDPEAGCFYYVMELADDMGAEDRTQTAQSLLPRPLARRSPSKEETGLSDASASQLSSVGAQPPICPDSYHPKTLRGELKWRGRLTAEQCITIGVDLTTALAQLHNNRLVHRDIKPSNIIFVAGVPKLADIGLVTSVDATRSLVGTEGYRAPEGAGKPPADIFSLGKVLYEMATGKDRMDFPELPSMGAMTKSERKALLELNEIFLNACRLEVRDRYQTADQMQSDFERLREGRSVALIRKLKLALLLAGGLVVLLALAALGAGFLYFQKRAAEQKRLVALKQVKLSRTGQVRVSGWFWRNWSQLDKAAQVRRDADVLEQAASVLAGADGHAIKIHTSTAGATAMFGPDGRALVGGTSDNGAFVLETNGVKTELVKSQRIEGPVWWATNGVPMQLIPEPNACVVLDLSSGAIKHNFTLPEGEQVGRVAGPVLAVTSDGSRVAASLSNQVSGVLTRVLTWDNATGQLLGEARIPGSALAFIPDGSLLAVGQTNGNIQLLRVPGMAPIGLLPPLRSTVVRCLAFGRNRVVHYADEAPTDRWFLAAGYHGGTIAIWDLSTNTRRSICHGSDWQVSSLAFHPLEPVLASAGRQLVPLWDVMTGRPLLRIEKGSGDDARALAFNANGTRLVWGTEFRAQPAAVGLWALSPHRGIHTLRGLSSNVRKVWFAPNSQLVAALADDWHLGVWEIQADRLVWIFEVPLGVVADNAGGVFDAQSALFAFATGREARLYDLATGCVLDRWSLAIGATDQLQFDRHGRLLLARREHDEGFLYNRHVFSSRWKLYELLPGSKKPTLLHQQTNTNWATSEIEFLAGGEWFFAWTFNSNRQAVVRAYAVANGQQVTEWATARPWDSVAMVSDPGGQWFGYDSGQSDRFRLIELPDLHEAGRTPMRPQAISPSGKEFAVAAANGWQVCEGLDMTHAIPLGMDWNPIIRPSFSPDGRLLAWGTLEGVVLVADLQEVRRRLGTLGRSGRQLHE